MRRIGLLLTAILCYSVSYSQFSMPDRNYVIQLTAKNSAVIGITQNDVSNLIVTATYKTKEGIRMAYLQQGYKGVPVYNRILVLAFKGDQLVSHAGTFIPDIESKVNLPFVEPVTSAADAVRAALQDRNLTANRSITSLKDSAGKKVFGTLGVSSSSIRVELVWLPVGKVVNLTWQVYLDPVNTADMWMIRIDAINNRVLDKNNLTVYDNWALPAEKAGSVSNKSNSIKKSNAGLNYVNERKDKPGFGFRPFVVNNASYRVIPWPAESPNHPGGTPAVVNNPWQNAPGNATTLGWHFDNVTYHDSTRGNNVWAQEDRDANNNTFGRTAQSSTAQPNLTLEFNNNFTLEPTTTDNQRFAITNLFYWNNIIHDISYLYGFDEVSANFQANNLSRGGLGNDYVIADAQDAVAFNNANFGTPSDGSRPRMQMFLFNNPTPDKDGDLDNGIIVHEYGHGISNRFTGGGTNVSCLDNEEQGGEGWSDYLALMYTTNWANTTVNDGPTPRAMGTYVLNQSTSGGGIRIHPYSTNMAVNPWTYGDMAATGGESHDIGEIWCTALWEMTWEIIAQTNTINSNLYNVGVQGGNSIALKLVMEGMRLQPCSPGFIDARNAILKADTLLYGGAYSCSIWKAFAKRGMGRLASQGSSSSTADQIADFTVDNSVFSLTQNASQAAELQNIVYTSRITAGNCTPISNYFITDTLPTSVTWVSGGTYNAANRTVTFSPVSLSTNQSQTFSYTVNVNAGTYFTPVDHLTETVSGATIPATWAGTSTVSAPNVWTISTTQGHAAPNSFFAPDPGIVADMILTSTQSYTLTVGTASYSTLSFWHKYNVEAGYDGGVVEISTNGGANWIDLGSRMIRNGYNGFISPSDGSPIPGRPAFTGNSGASFIQTIVNLSAFNGQTVKIRFRMTADGGVAGVGWFIDDIVLRSEPAVFMRSSLFNNSNVRQSVSDTITTIINPCIVAAVSVQPSTTTAACAGGNATINVTATGSSVTYQWQVNTGSGYTNLTNAAPYSGVTTAALTITNVTAGMNGYLYRCVVTNSCTPAAVNSNVSTLTLQTASAITGQPSGATACVGTDISFNVTATGSSVTYQWQVNTGSGFVNLTNVAPYSGVTTATLNITAATLAMNGYQYHCVVSNTCSPATSNNATLTISGVLQIASQPDDMSVCTGTDASFDVGANGAGINYQWQVNAGSGFVNLSDDATYSGTTTPVIVINTPPQSMSGYLYRCIISSAACAVPTISNAATLLVDPPPFINAQPSTQAVCAGTNVVFNIQTAGTIVSYQWQISTNGGGNWNDINGATASTLNVNGVTAAQSGNMYRVVITGACTNTTSNAATLTVNTAPSITGDPTGSTVCPGTSFTFTVGASGNGVTYQWQISTNGGGNWNDINGATSSSFILSGITTAMNGNRFRCVVSGTCAPAVTSNAAILNVNTAVSILGQPSSTAICAGSVATFNVQAVGTGLTYQWQSSPDGVNWTNAGNTSVIQVTGTVNGMRYRVLLGGACGNVTSNVAILTVNPVPDFTIGARPLVCLSDTSFLLTATDPTGNWSGTGVQINRFNPALAGIGVHLVSYTVTNSFGCTTTRSTTVQVSECPERHRTLDAKDALKIYPNPNPGKFFIEINSDLYTKLGMRVYSAEGRLVRVQDFNGLVFGTKLSMDLRQLQDGVYMLYFFNETNGNFISKTLRIVIAR